MKRSVNWMAVIRENESLNEVPILRLCSYAVPKSQPNAVFMLGHDYPSWSGKDGAVVLAFLTFVIQFCADHTPANVDYADTFSKWGPKNPNQSEKSKRPKKLAQNKKPAKKKSEKPPSNFGMNCSVADPRSTTNERVTEQAGLRH